MDATFLERNDFDVDPSDSKAVREASYRIGNGRLVAK